eukprot:UN11162
MLRYKKNLGKKPCLSWVLILSLRQWAVQLCYKKAAADPSSFDLYEQWSDSINILWQAGAIQPIETERLRYWHEINPLSKTGKNCS